MIAKVVLLVMFKAKDKLQSVYLKWFLSYIFVLMLPISISSIVFYQAQNIIEDENNRANASIIKQVQQTIDSRVKEIEQFAIQVGVNSQVQWAINIKEEFSAKHQFNIYEIIKNLRTLKFFNELIDEYYIYLPQNNNVLSTSGRFDSKTIYSALGIEPSIKYDEWINLMDNVNYRKYYPVYNQKSEEQKSRIAYMQSLPINDPTQVLGTIVIFIDTNKLLKVLEGIELIDRGTVFIIDSNNEIQASTNNNYVNNGINYKELGENEGLLNSKVGGVPVTISHIDSDINDWKYVSVVPTSVYKKKVENIKQAIYFSYIICIILGLTIAYWITKRNYNPISDLIDKVAKGTGLTFSVGNEYKFIKEAVDSAILEKGRIEEVLSEQTNLIRNDILLKLINGNFGNEHLILESLNKNNINFKTNHFVVMLFRIEDFSGLFPEDDPNNPLNPLNTVHFIIGNVVEELISEKHQVYSVRSEDMMVCIISLNGINDKIRNNNYNIELQLKNTIEKAQDFFEKNFEVYFTASISTVNRDLSSLSNAYREALEAMEYRLVFGKQKVILYNDVISRRGRYKYDIESKNKLVNNIKTGNFETVLESINEIFSEIIYNKDITVEMVKCFIYDIISTLTKVLDETCEAGFIEELNLTKKLLYCQTLEEMEKSIVDILKPVCENVNKRKATYHISKNIKEFIDENYTDINMNVAMIGNEFNKAPSYLSKLFKEQTGETLPDYINKTKIAKVKYYLLETNLSILDIADKVGYSNSNVLIRTFKKYEGVTPGKFKEMSRE